MKPSKPTLRPFSTVLSAQAVRRILADGLNFSYLRPLFAFAFSNNPLLYLTLSLSIISVLIEMAAMTILLPLTSLVAGTAIDKNSKVIGLVEAIHLNPTGQVLLLLFVALFSLRVVTQFCAQSLIVYLGKRILLQLTTRAFHALIKNAPMQVLEAHNIGYFITLAGDESSRSSTLIVTCSQFISQLLLGALYFLAIAFYSPNAAVAVTAFLFVTFFALLSSFRASHRLGVRQIAEAQRSHSVLIDSLNGLRSVRAFSAEDYVTENYFWNSQQYFRTQGIVEIISLAARFGPALILLLAAGAIASLPSIRSQFSLDIAYIVTLVILLMRFFPIVGQTLNLALRAIADARAGRDVTNVITEYQAPTESVSAGSPAETLSEIDHIEFSNVSFSHARGRIVLRDLNLTLRRGMSYALVGLSGSGKSTLLDLLLGFYSPQKGRIRLNGTDSTKLRVEDIRKRIALVTQDTTIFNDTVENNLRLGLDVSSEQMEHSCRIAHIHDFITSLPNGYKTMLSYRGANLSGGQRQRLGLARAVLRKPDVLLLDESTAALDAETREQVVSQLLAEFEQRIILFVTHDKFVVSKAAALLDMSGLNSIECENPSVVGAN